MEIVACPDCDVLQQLPRLAPGAKARCLRCGHVRATQPTDSLDRALALMLTAAIVFVVANTSPLMGLSAAGRQASTSIINGAYEMWPSGRGDDGDRRVLCGDRARKLYFVHADSPAGGAAAAGAALDRRNIALDALDPAVVDE
jgi:hypothetical protein